MANNIQEEWDAAMPVSQEIQAEWDSARPVSKKEDDFYKSLAIKAGKFLSTTAAETTGMVGGARVGAAMGAPAGPMGAIAGGVLGAGLGYGAAKGAERLAGGEPVDYKTPIEGMGYEMGGQVVGYGIGKAWGAVANRLLPKRDPEMVRVYKKFGIEPRPSEVSPSSKTATIMESALGYHPISGDIAVENSMQRMEQYNHIYKQLVDRGASTKDLYEVGHKIRQEAGDFIRKYVAAGDEEVAKLTTKFMDQMGIPQPSMLSVKYAAGNTIRQRLEDTRTAIHNDTKTKYEIVDDLLGKARGEKIPVSENTYATVNNLYREEMAAAPSKRDTNVLNTLRDFKKVDPREAYLKQLDDDSAALFSKMSPAAQEQIIGEFAKTLKPKSYTWEGLKKTVSELKEANRKIYHREGFATNEVRVNQQLIDAIEADMATFARSKGDDIWGAYQSAKAASFKEHELFDKDVLGIMQLSGEQLVKKLTASPVDFLKQIRKVGGDETVSAVKSLYLQDTYVKSLTKEGRLDPTKFMSNLRKLGQDKLNEIIPQEQQRLLDAYTKKLDLLGKRFFGADRAKEMEFLEVITNTSNHEVANYLVKSKNRNVITYAKNLFSPERLLEVQEQALLQTLATSPQGNFMPAKAARNFYANEKNLKAILPEELFTDVKDFVKMTSNDKRVEALATNASHTGQVLIGHSMFTHPITAIKTMGLSWALAKIYFNDAARGLFVNALKYPANHPQAISDFTKAWSLAIGNVLTQQDIPEGMGL